MSTLTDRYKSNGHEAYKNLGQLLVKCAKGKDTNEEVQWLLNFYRDDLNEFKLLRDLTMFKMLCDESNVGHTVTDLIEFIRQLSPSLRSQISEIFTIAALILVIPCTNACSEHSFSTLRRIKTWLRATMIQERLNHCMIYTSQHHKLPAISP